MEDKGHDKLITDLSALLFEATQGEFHDFKNSKYALPKVELRTRLLKMANDVMDGQYDN